MDFDGSLKNEIGAAAYESELKDLLGIYKQHVDELDFKIAFSLPGLVINMEHFTECFRERELMKSKIKSLTEKMGEEKDE